MAKKTKQEMEVYSASYIKSSACYNSTNALELYVKLLTSKISKKELKGKKVLFLGIGNEGIVRRFKKELELDEVYVLCDFGESTEYFDEKCKTLGTLPLQRKNLKKTLEQKLRTMVKSLGMKFDIVIANPPYFMKGHQALYLEIMEAVLNSGCLNEDYKVVTIQPVGWLLSQINKRLNKGFYKKFSAFRESIVQLDYISKGDADKIFGIDVKSPLGIYVSSNTTKEENEKCVEDFYNTHMKIADDTHFFDNVTVACSACKGKHASKVISIANVLQDRNKATAFHCFFNAVHGHIDKPDYYDTISPRKEVVRGNKEENGAGGGKEGTRLKVVNFDSEEEAENFRLSLYGVFYKYANACYKTGIDMHYSYLPWMGEAVNPRTGLLGYKGEWTDEDLFNYFQISGEEQDRIKKKLTDWQDDINRNN